jgi:outer membrane protein
MKKLTLLLLVPLFVQAESLKSLLMYAQKSNELIVSKSISTQAKNSAVQSSESSYYPTLDLGGFYQRFDDASPFSPGTTYSGYAKVSFDVYDGGEKSYTLKQKKDEYSASNHEYEATKKDITLGIVQDFYNCKTLEATLEARVEASVAVQAQLERMQKFYSASLATSDDVDRLQSAYDSNIYGIESIKFQILSLKKSLELKIGKRVDMLDASSFTKLDGQSADELDVIKATKAKQSSIMNAAQTIDSYYYPNIKIEDTYSLYGYQDVPALGGATLNLPENQNKIMASVNLRLFDFGAIGEAKQAVKLNADALSQQIVYQTKEQQMNQELALSRIQTANLNIQSAKSALKAARSALETITKKYNNGIVDNVVYLDALSSQTEAKSTYEASLNNLELSYALYYYYNGKKIEEFLHD